MRSRKTKLGLPSESCGFEGVNWNLKKFKVLICDADGVSKKKKERGFYCSFFLIFYLVFIIVCLKVYLWP